MVKKSLNQNERKINRRELQGAFSLMSREDRRKLAEHMGYTMSTLRRYCLEPSSEKIGQDRLKKFLEFYPQETWLELAEKAEQMKPVEVIFTWPELDKLPDVIIINKQKYFPEA